MKKCLAATILLVVVFCLFVSAQSNKKSLLISNFDSSESLGETQHLYRYDFVDGEYVSKEFVVSSKNVSFEHGLNRIYQNRYAITKWGDIIDVQKKKILHKSAGELLRIDGNKVFIEVNRYKKNGLFVYDLSTNNYGLVRKTKPGFGNLSPNGYRRVWANASSISIYENGKDWKLGTFSLKVEPDELSSDMLKVATFWLDDERLLTQKGNGQLVIVDLKGNVTPLLKIEDEPACVGNPVIYEDVIGRLIYECKNSYVIDVQNKSYKLLNNDLGFGFGFQDNERSFNKYSYNGKDIGKIWSSSVRTTDGFIAVKYAKEGENLGYPDGIKVWNNIKNDWTTLEINWGANIIGWINE